jgi:hypothetical protein
VIKSLLSQLFDGLAYFPSQAAIFLAGLTRPGQFVPNNFLSEYEMKRLDLDELAALRTCGYPQRSMMIGGFILIKVLICRVFAPSNFQNLLEALQLPPLVPGSQTYNGPRFNLKLVSSLFYYQVVEYMETLLQTKGYSEDLIWTCGLRKLLYRHPDLKLYYKNENYKTRCDHFFQLETFLKSLNKILVRNLGIGSISQADSLRLNASGFQPRR